MLFSFSSCFFLGSGDGVYGRQGFGDLDRGLLICVGVFSYDVQAEAKKALEKAEGIRSRL